MKLKMVSPLFSVGQKVWDRYTGRPGVVVSIETDIYYMVDTGFGPLLTCECDLEDFYTAKTFRKGVEVKVSELYESRTESTNMTF